MFPFWGNGCTSRPELSSQHVHVFHWQGELEAGLTGERGGRREELGLPQAEMLVFTVTLMKELSSIISMISACENQCAEG